MNQVIIVTNFLKYFFTYKVDLYLVDFYVF